MPMLSQLHLPWKGKLLPPTRTAHSASNPLHSSFHPLLQSFSKVLLPPPGTSSQAQSTLVPTQLLQPATWSFRA